MSGVNLTGTTFVGHDGKTTYGFRMYDEYDKTYDNNSEAVITDDFELLEYAIGCEDSTVKGMVDFCQENQKGMTINGTWYDYDEIVGYLPCSMHL